MSDSDHDHHLYRNTYYVIPPPVPAPPVPAPPVPGQCHFLMCTSPFLLSFDFLISYFRIGLFELALEK